MPRKTVPIDPRPCAHCGTVFTPKKRRDQQYCSSECAKAAEYARKRKRNPTEADLIITLKGRRCSNFRCGSTSGARRYAVRWSDGAPDGAELGPKMLLCSPCFKRLNSKKAGQKKRDILYDLTVERAEILKEDHDGNDKLSTDRKRLGPQGDCGNLELWFEEELDKRLPDDLRGNFTCEACGKFSWTIADDGSMTFGKPFPGARFKAEHPPIGDPWNSPLNCPRCQGLDGRARVVTLQEHMGEAA